MSNVGDAFSGQTSGTTDTSGASSFGDTPNLTNSDFSGLTDADIMGSGGSGGPSEFNSVSALTNALSGGGTGTSSVGAQSAAMTPPSAAATTGGDPTGATGGTQSSTAPGAAPANSNQPQGQNQQQQSEHAPPDAVNQLKALIKSLSGKPTGPTGQIPQASALDPATAMKASGISNLLGSQPAAARLPPAAPPQVALPGVTSGETGPQSPQGRPPLQGGIQTLPTVSAGETGDQSATLPKTDADGNPLTVAGTRADQTPLPPPRPGDATAPSTTGGKPTPKTDDQGREITVKKGDDADLPTHTPLPTKKPGAAPAPASAEPSQIIKDITGTSTGVPTALPELAKMAMALAPLIGMFMGGGGRRGHFHGGRFTHGVPGGRGFSGFRGGQRAMGGGRHPPPHGPWLYHHPGMGWRMHHDHPGGGWRPLSPQDAHGMGILGSDPASWGNPPGQDPNAPDPNKPPPEGGNTPYQGETEPNGGKGPWEGNPFLSTLVGAESGGHQGPGVRGDGGLATGYYQIQTPTWGDFAPKVPGAGGYAKAEQAPPNVQQAVASIIPVYRFGQRTKDILHERFGQFDEHMTVGQAAERFASRSAVSGKPRSVSTAATIPTTLPITSQPMVSG